MSPSHNQFVSQWQLPTELRCIPLLPRALRGGAGATLLATGNWHRSAACDHPIGSHHGAAMGHGHLPIFRQITGSSPLATMDSMATNDERNGFNKRLTFRFNLWLANQEEVQ